MPLRPLLAPLIFGLTVGLLLAAGPSCGKVPVSGCGPTTCAGCCAADGSCVKSPNNAAVASCGANGAACANCGKGACVGFACSGAGGGNGSCGASCTGCCSGTSASSICIRVPSAINCGSGGLVCTSCLAGQACVGGKCQSSDGGANEVGTPCVTNDNCAALGAGHLCKLKTSSGASNYTGGYCTKDCIGNADCPSSALCLSAPGLGEGDSVCWSRCTAPADCRSGYDCYSIGGGDSACWISPLPAFDAGPPADKVGHPCATDVACQSPPDDGVCLFANLSDGGPSPFLSGYCTAPCDDSSHCGTGAKCLSVAGFGVCAAGCNAPSTGQADCRAGYVCRPVRDVDGGALPDGFCWPRCNNPGATCGTATCLASGYCG